MSTNPYEMNISFELYPPRRTEAADAVWEAVRVLSEWQPCCFSVTYPSTPIGRAASVELVQRIAAETDVEPIAHLTVAGASRIELAEHVHKLFDLGVRNILALRGDSPAGQEWSVHPGGLNRAAELVELIHDVATKRNGAPGAVNVGCAAYPHSADDYRVIEVQNLLEKQQAGANYAITQVFYNVDEYALLVRAARDAGVSMPIVPGIIPLTDPARLERLAVLTGVEVPAKVSALEGFCESERFDKGIELTADLVEATVAAGARGVHVFTFNQARPASALCAELTDRRVLHPTPTKGLA